MSNNEIVFTGASEDLRDLEIETFEVESLTDLGIVAAVAAEIDLTVACTSSTTSSTCCG
jgi:thiazolylpeptide-type bacteriocin precursor